jgi:tetratricopeptide (TPR) repeat protein
MRTHWIGAGVASLLLLCSGCSGLEYMETNELWAKGDEAFDEGRYDDAIPYYDELIDRNESESRAILFRGVSRERDGNPDGAARDYSRAADLGEVRALLYSANMNIAVGDTTGAEGDLAALRDAGLTGRDRVVQLTLLGTLRLRQGRHRMAIQSLERAVSEGGSYNDYVTRVHVGNAHHNAAEAYYAMGDFERAYGHFLSYMRGGDGGEASGSSQDHYTLGLLAYLAGDYDASETHLAKADPALVAEGQQILDDPGFGPGQ